MHIGYTAKENVLVCGNLDEFSIKLLTELSSRLFLYQCGDEIHENSTSIKVLERSEITDYRYDAVIIDQRSLEATFDTNEVSVLVGQCLSENGVICLYEAKQNLKSYLRNPQGLLRRFSRGKRKYQPLALVETDLISQYETISYSPRPYESFRAGRYHNNKNIFLIKEKFRRFVLRTWLYRFVTNSNIWIIRKSKHSNFLIKELLEHIRQLGVPWKGQGINVLKIQYRPGKLLVSLTSSKRSTPEYIAVIALDDAARKQRDNEEKSMRYLKGRSQVAPLIAAYHQSTEFGIFYLYIMSEMDGMTVDIDNRFLSRMTTSASQTIALYGGDDIRFDTDGDLQNTLQLYFESLYERFPEHQNAFVSAIDFLASVNFENFPVVFMHGDAKLENFVLNKNYEVIGIIDFELSEIRGFPLLDLFYLIAYNHLMTNDARFDVVYRKLVENDLLAYEQEMIDACCQRYGISDYQRKVLELIFFMHHYAKRYRVMAKFGESWREFENSLAIANRLIQSMGNPDDQPQSIAEKI